MKSFIVKDSYNVAKIGPCKINCVSKVPVFVGIWKYLHSIMSKGVNVMTPLG